MSPGTGGIAVTGLHKAFAAQPVLRGVDLTIPAGAFAVVLGASGSGKTTLLRILAGFERPDQGVVALDGAVLDSGRHHLPAERRRVGYVSQEGSLFPHLTVAANVGFGLSRTGRRGPEVAELLERVGLSGLERRFPHQLSGGQQQRVALARALAVHPRLVLLDEPFAALDAGMRAAIRADVRDAVRRSGATAVLVTHDQDEALSVADLVAVIRDGTIAEVASPRDLYDQPADPDLAGFVGAANLIEGTGQGPTVLTRLGTLALRGGEVAAGEPVTVLVRPEQLRVALAGGAGRGVPARVVDSAFHGHDTVVRVVAGGGAAQPMVARVGGLMRLAPGAEVVVEVSGGVHCWTRRQTGGAVPGDADAAG